MEKTTARTCAMKLIYEWEMGGVGGDDTITELLEIVPDEDGIDFMNSLVSGVQENCEAIDEKISAYLKGWTIERLAKVDLAILRLAVFELLYMKTATAIAVNEAVELAKTYSTDRAGGFINGVLGNLMRGIISSDNTL